MNKTQIIKSVLSKPAGTFFKISWGSEIPVYKKYQGVFTVKKYTEAIVRCGINYDNMKLTKERRMDGSAPSKNSGLPWGSWLIDGYVIENKGKTYLRCYLGANNKPKTLYSLNGKLVHKEDLYDICGQAKLNSTAKQADTFTLNMDNIIEVG